MLTMEEVLGLRLDADWVVLLACNTAAAGRQSGESISGLGRAFFYAGARALLVTHWAVETESARMLTTEMFRLLAAEPGLSVRNPTIVTAHTDERDRCSVRASVVFRV
ncbi:MAG: CHAT domain-containing protein [Pseudomonadales bacterium]|nr:CHAT domain-containing protein [Pseudomonadales bacterium]